MTTRPPMRLLATVIAWALLAACTEPPAVETAAEGAEDPVEAEVLDPTSDELRVLLDEMRTTVADGRDALQRASEASSQPDVRAAADEALALLLDDPDRSTDPMALLPARTSDRGTSGDQDDLLTSALSLARDAGGTLGRATVATLRDAVAGDVGAWERDAEGVIANTEAAVAGVTDIDTASANVLALDGDATRALAWTMLAMQSADADLARRAAERGAGHLGVVLVTIELLIDPPPPADEDPDVELEGEQVPDELDGRVDDAAGRVDGTDDAAGTYDAAGRVDGTDDAAGTYDAAGRVDGTDDAAGTYDAAGRVDGTDDADDEA